ncbi:tetratricopeptide repeat protein, partial [Aquipseudomonas alcaligenes]
MSTPHLLPDTPLEGGNNPQAPGSIIAWALHLCQRSRDAEAIAVLQQGLVQHPGNRKMTLLLARCLRNEGQYQSAHDLLAPLLAQAPDDIDLLKLWATVLQTQGRLPEAIANLKQVLQLLCQRPDISPPTAQPAQRSCTQQDLPVLWQTLAQLAADGVHAFATAGTLLGLTREGRLLAGDKDIDIGLPWLELPAAIRSVQKLGWLELYCSNGLSNPRSFVYPGSGLTLDLCAFAEDSVNGGCVGGFWMPGIPPHWNRLTNYPLMQLQLSNSPAGRIWALRAPEVWLESLYGSHWRLPDPGFDSSISAHNLRGFSELTQCYALLRI